MRSHIGLLVMSYGTPCGLDDVAAFYTHIRGDALPPPSSSAASPHAMRPSAGARH